MKLDSPEDLKYIHVTVVEDDDEVVGVKVNTDLGRPRFVEIVKKLYGEVKEREADCSEDFFFDNKKEELKKKAEKLKEDFNQMSDETKAKIKEALKDLGKTLKDIVDDD